MDCSSPYAMASLIAQKDRFQIATGNDADADRHGIVTPDGGLMNPNHFLAVAIEYLMSHRPDWRPDAAVGKTVVSSSMIDRVTASLGRRLWEVPVGFKWFVPGLIDGSVAFGGEESAGASFLRRDGRVWTTDKDGLARVPFTATPGKLVYAKKLAAAMAYVALTNLDRVYWPADPSVDPPLASFTHSMRLA